MTKLTLKKISKELDVSISTVSKALRDSSEISTETKQKIKAFAALYKYKPNNIALSLKNRKTKTLGVIVPEIVHHFFTTVISGIEAVANQKGYNVIIGLSNESFDKEVLNIQMLANGSIDGFILSVSKETQLLKDYHHLEETINQGMPIVLFDRIIPNLACDKVTVDDAQGAYQATQLLIDKGCKHIGIITTMDYVTVGRLRTNGYQAALKDNALKFNDAYILRLEDKLNEIDMMDLLEAKIHQFFINNPELDAVFAVNEVYALTAMRVARRQGKHVPDQVKVIGFTDGFLSKYAIPSLSTVSQHGKELGAQAASLLIDRLEKDEETSYKEVVIPTEVIVRESTS